MQIDLSEQQLEILLDVLEARLEDGQCGEPPKALQHDRDALEELHNQLRQIPNSDQIQAWEGYTETRKLPCNPAPG